jgi:formylglycine-generating enzyme required for sulfatase activity
MLATVRLSARALGKDVERLDLPKTSRDGPDETDRTILFAACKIALEYLAQDPAELQMPVNPATMGEDHRTSKEGVLQHLRRCMLGLPVTQHDRTFLLINALTEPLEVEGPPPPDSPAIIAHEETFRLKRSGLELCWIPPIAHWLGADDEDLPIQNPIRRFTPDQGYFIARYPMTARDAQRIFSHGKPADPVESAGAEELYLCNWSAGVHVCDRLREIEGVKVTLPTADQREMAARGTDGRRYPWGSGFEANADKLASPWGIEKAIGGINEWTSTTLRTGEHVIFGGKEDLRCASRSIVPTDDSNVRYAVRPVVLIANT